MYGRSVALLTGLVALLGVGEIASALIIWRDNYPGGAPLLALLFSVPFFVVAALLRWHRVLAGAILAIVLSLFELANFPTWERRSTLDWVYQVGFAMTALASLVVAIAVVVLRHRAAVAVRHGATVS